MVADWSEEHDLATLLQCVIRRRLLGVALQWRFVADDGKFMAYLGCFHLADIIINSSVTHLLTFLFQCLSKTLQRGMRSPPEYHDHRMKHRCIHHIFLSLQYFTPNRALCWWAKNNNNLIYKAPYGWNSEALVILLLNVIKCFNVKQHSEFHPRPSSASTSLNVKNKLMNLCSASQPKACVALS